jgi:ribonuclease P protein component
VRQNGKSYAHPLIVLLALPGQTTQVQVAVTASRSVGNAVQRNHVKRLLREALRPLLPQIVPGWELVILSRSKAREASLAEIQEALVQVMRRARLLL